MNCKSKSKGVLQFVVILFLISIFFFFSSSAASHKIDVKGIRYWSSPDYTRVVVDLSGPVEFSKNRIANPDRLYFDLQNTSLEKEIKTNLPVGDGILKMVRAGQFNPSTVRVVLDLEKITDFNVFIIDDPARLVIDVYGADLEDKKPEALTIKRRIVIDPGHGGHDPGAVGPKNLYEKDVVFDIAVKLKKILAENPLNDVFLTRETDIFIPLEERTAIANNKNADLFISIHANASPKRKARGIETYLLNWTNDEEALRVAARENAISLKKMREMNRQMDMVKVITEDLMRQNKRDESVKLANYIQKSMVSTLNNDSKKYVVDLGVKQALFYVLFGARMPSVLVEVSFISNPEEEKLLSKDSYRMQISRAIAAGLDTYIISTPVAQKVAGI
ncbi:MAG: N-acetylmuramoyl-L-alanine amidase [Nitrospirota bacterium]|nr:N-acetylmuramoyl-L-alanine amidase [Nitrospirota bacterium]MDH5767919.1 N-acetylmuramoyl-L-alanine amidase [Nitrospirota bacterium]